MPQRRTGAPKETTRSRNNKLGHCSFLFKIEYSAKICDVFCSQYRQVSGVPTKTRLESRIKKTESPFVVSTARAWPLLPVDHGPERT